MQSRLSYILSWLIIALIFFIPSNLFLVLNESWGYVNGLRIDYLLPKLFFTDLLIVPIILIGLWLKQKIIFPWLKKNRWLVFVGILLIIAQLFAQHTWTSFFTILKGIELGLLFIVLLTHKEFLKNKHISMALIASILVQLSFTLYQFVFQKSATPYWLTGESELHGGVIGLARSNFGGEERLLAYGTTAHPNILAGMAVLFFLITIHLTDRKKAWWLLLPVTHILLFTQSISATVALAIGLLITLKKDLFTSNILRIVLFLTIITPFFINAVSNKFDATSLTRRAELHKAALAMVESKPLIGVGLNNFTVVLEDYIQQKEFVRFVQPVHNSIWLLAAESGMLGLMLLWMICKELMQRFTLSPVLLSLIPILSLDHYLTTTQSGILLLIIFLAFSLKKTTLRRH